MAEPAAGAAVDERDEPAAAEVAVLAKPERTRVLRWWPVAVWLTVEWVLIDAVALATSRPWVPVNDWAIIDDEVRNVGQVTPLIGAFSRYGWRHPGPWMFWLLAVPYRLGGSSTNAILVGVAVLNAAAIGGIAITVYRRGGRLLFAIVMFALAVLLHTLGVGLMIDPWNTWLPFLPFVWLIFLVWDAVCGRRWAMAWALGVGSFVVQCHVGYALPVAVLGAWLVFRAVRDRKRPREQEPSWRRVGLVLVVVAFVLWMPVAIDQVTAEEGNVTALWNFFAHGEQPGGVPVTEATVGPSRGLTIVANELAGWPPWLGAKEIIDQSEADLSTAWLLALPAFALGCVWWSSRRRGWTVLRDAAITGLVALAATVVATMRIVGPPFHWLTRFSWASTVFIDVVIVWAVATIVLDSAPLRRYRTKRGWQLAGAVVSLVAILGLTVLTVSDDTTKKLPLENLGQPAAVVGPAVVEALRASGERSVVVSSLGQDQGVISASVVDQLAAAGFTVYADGVYGTHFQPEYQVADHRYRMVAVVVAGDDEIERTRANWDLDPIVRYDPPAGGGLAPVAVFVKSLGNV